MESSMKNLTIQQRYKRKALALDIISYGSFPVAFGILLAFRAQDWFSKGTASSVDIGIGFGLALVVFVLACLKKVSYLKGIWGWFLALGITYFLRAIINELWVIVLALTCAQFIFWLLGSMRNEAHKACELVKDTTIQEKVKRDLSNEYTGRV